MFFSSAVNLPLAVSEMYLNTYAAEIVYTGGENGFSEAQAAFADIKDDGKTDAKDASLVLAYYSLVSRSKVDVPTMKEYIASLNNHFSDTTKRSFSETEKLLLLYLQLAAYSDTRLNMHYPVP